VLIPAAADEAFYAKMDKPDPPKPGYPVEMAAKPRPVRNPKFSDQILALWTALEGWHYGFLTGRGLAACRTGVLSQALR
jgi:hypothetical protein